ncbi:hypothetical protein ACPYO6_15500 [Georgenia sp. Z1344]|uniref:hypothetical protein n=1 Tax=Georgenia sp. Z1344 TaxID=3416706 RepID=UPI003CF67357
MTWEQPPLDGGRSSISDIAATTLGALLMTAAAVGVLHLMATYADPDAPGANATIAACTGAVAYAVVRIVQRFRMDARSWYTPRSDRRSMSLPTALVLDQVQGVLLYAPPVVLTVLAAERGDRHLALTGATCAVVLGVLTAMWAVRWPLLHTGLRQVPNQSARYEPVVGFVRRAVPSRLLRMLLGLVLAAAGAAAGALVPEPRPVLGMMLAIILVLGSAAGVFLRLNDRWDRQEGRRRERIIAERQERARRKQQVRG